MTERQRIGVVSATFPPARNGQAVMLDRILAGFSEESFSLISMSPINEGPSPLPFPFHWRNGYTLRHRISLRLWPFRELRREIKEQAKYIEQIGRSDGLTSIVSCSANVACWPAAASAAARLGVPFYLYAFDCYGKHFDAQVSQLGKAMKQLAHDHEGPAVAQASRIIVPNEALADYYRQLYSKDVRVVRNPVAAEFFADLKCDMRQLEATSAVIVYTGNVYEAQEDAIENVTKAAALLDTNASVRIVGYCQPQVHQKLRAAGPVEVLPEQPPAEIIQVQRNADILLLPLAFHSRFPQVIATSAPGKMAEYLVSGRPILVHAPKDSYLAWFFRENDCGWLVDEPDVKLVAATIKEIIASPERSQQKCRRAREIALRDYHVEKARADFASAIDLVGC